MPRSGHGHDRALSSDIGHDAPTSAIDAKPEHTRVVTRHPARPWLPTERWLQNWSLRAASMAGATPTRRTRSRSACMAARRPRWIRARAPSSRSRLAASVGPPLLTGATKAATARPRERASSGRGRGAFWPRGDGAIAGAGCRTLTGATTCCSFTHEPPSTKSAHERTAPNGNRGGSAPARMSPAAASLRPSRET